jgi:hypothetical protein
MKRFTGIKRCDINYLGKKGTPDSAKVSGTIFSTQNN